MSGSFLGDRKIVFLGTPTPAAEILERLVAEGFEICEIVTGADARRGRGGAVSPSPVKQVASAHGIPVRHSLDDVSSRWEDVLGIVVAYGRIIPADLLARTSMINVHFSLLPRWRGAAPVERAILAGDETTGVCIMEVVEELDAGGVFASGELPVGASTRDELLSSLTRLGAELLVRTLRGRPLNAVPQEGEPTYARKISPDEGSIDWSADAVSVSRVVRALRAHTTVGGRRLRVLGAEPLEADGKGRPGDCDDSAVVTCGSGSLRLVRVQPEGRAVLDARDWRLGVRGDLTLGA